jgi:cellulose synthase operon protein C
MRAVLSAAPESSLLVAALTLLPDPQRRLLRGCALVTTLNETIAGEIARDIGGVDGATMAGLAAYPFVYEVRDKPGHYRVRDDVRRALIESWWEDAPSDSVPPELAGLSARLAERLANRLDPAEVVGLRLFADPLDGLEQWKRLYAQADRRFDLAGCRSLIAMLGWMAAVESEVEDVREDYATYVEARSLWTDEWYRTGSFLLPAQSEQKFDSLIEGSHGRMLELQGHGGYGKSMHIRWLIARRCVLATTRIPCARVDFDAIDPLAAVREPHLVLLELAEQLDRQLPGDAFGKLVRTYAADRVRLYRTSHSAAGARGPGEPADGQSRPVPGDEVLRRFAGRLAEMPPAQPVMLILDTLEVPLHLPDMSGSPAVERLLAALAAVLRQAPATRVVLAGRYDLGDGLRKLFADRCDRFVLPEFTEDEGIAYLTGKRGVDRDDLVRAALQASGRVPFSLALLADLIDEEPGINPGKIAEYHGAEYAYLVEKVVKRIQEQPVRWVLRYAAIPRRFDYDFVCDVLWRRVCGEMNGTGGLDVPADDDLPAAGDGEVLWTTGAAAQGEEHTVRQVWDQVRRYASGSSWISPDAQDPDALRLQPEVVRPLRGLLRKQPIFAVLHADASQYFLHRAAMAPSPDDGDAPGERARDRRDEFLRDAVFHRFQGEGEAAGQWWEEQIRTALSPADRRAMAGELVRDPEYTDQQGLSVPYGDHGTLVSAPTMQRARLEFCLASAELATLIAPQDPKHPFWLDASVALERLNTFRSDGLLPGRVALARAAVAIGTAQPEDPTADLRAALGDPGLAARERLWLAVLDARRLIAAGSRQADGRLEEAKQLEREAKGERAIRRSLAQALVMRLRERGALTEAMAACEAAVAEGLGDADFRLAQAGMLLSSGQAEAAREIAETVAMSDSVFATFAHVFVARCWRHQHRFTLAAARVRSVLTAQEEGRDASAPAISARASAFLELGEIAAARLRVQQARAAYADAARLFGEIDQVGSVTRCYVQEATLLISGLHHLRAAGVALDSAERAAPPGADIALLAQLTRAELTYALGDDTEAAVILERGRPEDPRASLPTRMAATAVAGLAFGTRRDRDRFTAQLTEGLREITPPTLKLQLLSRVNRCPVLTPESQSLAKAVDALREAVVPPGGWDAELAGLAAPDRITLRLHAAAFARMVDDAGESRCLLGAALAEIRGSAEPLVWLLDTLRQAKQLGAADLAAEAGQQAMKIAVDQAGECPLLAAVTVIEHVEAVLKAGGTTAEDIISPCQQAERWLGEEGSNAEAWRARLFELHAAIGINGREAAESYLKAAVQNYDAAGDVQAAERVQSQVTEPDARPARPRAIVSVMLRQTKVKAEVEGRRLRLPPSRRQTASGPLRDVIARWVMGATADPYPPELPDLMVSQWPGFTRALAELLSAAELTVRRRRTADRPDLAVRVYDGALQPLPWELAAHPRQSGPLFAEFRRAYRPSAHAAPDTRLVRVVQAGLNLLSSHKIQVDGVSGPDTARALDALGSAPDTPACRADDPETVQRLHQALLKGARPAVIVVRSAPSPTRRRDLALERRYAQAGFGVSTIDLVHLPALPALLRSEPPPVIVHVVGGLVATAGTTAVDLSDDAGSWRARDETGLLTSADLDQALRVVPLDWPAPVVVLDVPVPNGRRETGDQLLLRNCFAGDLFALGGTRAVVGTGLAPRKAARLVRDVLIEGLARGDAIADVVYGMRQQAAPKDFGNFEGGVAFAATALWSNDPSLRLPVQGRS